MNVSDRAWPLRVLSSLIARLIPAAMGFFVYRIVLQPHVRIDLEDQVAPAMFALASVIGVLAGFTGTAVVFIAGASGPGIDQIRLNHGRRLTNALLSAVVVLVISALGLAFCGLFANGWGAKATASALLAAPAYDVMLIFLALRSAMNSITSPKRKAQAVDEV
ncbi:Uncharacterised protein [Mycobacteroides abscessus subsp. abscessus]|nr:Uncharacterised protein [Mycobacteroides abscessus subsp. abscessus]SHT12976.1 Uncharacterised protein [Mycobacteroides abscessus subsp. abscessus]SHT78458.1 Uncharacterised protein [Mycobacteroides abscessus subsp. abscessus]SKE18039.1 Uncharacterised protein [Mycobacteroides abscessus subsp. abscessus]SKH76117.1 Uncharacterised protein [Mycobacteroides abscessus subsp. abscessus]